LFKKTILKSADYLFIFLFFANVPDASFFNGQIVGLFAWSSVKILYCSATAMLENFGYKDIKMSYKNSKRKF